MHDHSMSRQRFAIISGLSGVVGVVLLIVSFAINTGPPPQPGSAALIEFGRQHFASVLWGAWMQAVGPVLIVLFAFALVHLSGATQRLAGWMTLFGASVLMTVSLIEIVFYIAALNPEPPGLPSMSLRLIHATQHLYFMVAAPSLFLPLGIVLLRSQVLPQMFAHLALLLGAGFAILGIAFLQTMTLPPAVTAFGGVQALWWLAAAITLMVRSRRLDHSPAFLDHRSRLRV